MQLRQFLDQREPNGAAFIGPAHRALDAVESIEQARKFLRGDARARVAHYEFEVAGGFAQRDRDLSFESKLEGVGEQVQNIFSHISRSTKQGSRSGGPSITSFRRAMSVGSNDACMRPASILAHLAGRGDSQYR